MRREKNRWVATSIHLAISVVIFLVLVSVIYFWWFPGGLFIAAGGLEGIKIVAGVDLVLGPLLTLIVFNAAKPWRLLAKDLSVIGLIQISCLAAGMYVVYVTKPLVAVHVFDTFHVLNQENLDAMGIESERLDPFSGSYPKVVYVKVPLDENEFIKAYLLVAANAATEKQFEMRFESYLSMPNELSKRAAILHETEESKVKGCIDIKVTSAYGAGVVCFDPKKLSFGAFSPESK